MKILVNGVWRDTLAADVDTLLKEMGWGEAPVATALNGEFVPAGARGGARVADGDHLEVLAPMQGG
jgi:sulfur carrier protein